MTGETIWTPDGSTGHGVTRLLTWLAQRGRSFAGYDELWRWSVEDPEGFWGAFAEFAGVRWHDTPERVLADGSARMPGARWFPGGTLNYAEHALVHAERDPHGTAIIGVCQTRERTELSWAELAELVARCRAGLRRVGVGRGDRVVAYAPNIPETLVAFLATASLGAVWASCPPEFGLRAVIDRFTQIEPSVLLAADGYRYGDRVIDRRAEVEALGAALPSLRATIGLPYLGVGRDGWDELLAGDPQPGFEPVPADHPLYVLYSSGTTGLPKAIVHGHGGITIEHLKVLTVHQDIGAGDRFLWFTTTGWMMWNYLVSGLLTGTTIVTFDGNPAFPDLSTLWRLAATEHVTALGLSAPYIMSCRKAGLTPGTSFDLGALASISSTGAPLPAEGFRWLVEAVSPTAQPCSLSGGTDMCTGFVGMVPTIPVRAGVISRPALGAHVVALAPDGSSCPPGTQGELVITEPMPSMPVGLWNDPDGSRYRHAYFEDYPGLWRHGDWITFDAEGGCVISGRSDATLNRGGVRLGTADFYSVVEALPEITDSLVVHLDPGPGDDAGMGRLVLFVVLSPGVVLDDALRATIAGALRAELSPRHVPDEIRAIPVVPRTLSGKKLEVPVKRILQGVPAAQAAARDALADPSALDVFVALAAR